MEGRGRQLLIVAVIAGIAYWLYSHRAKDAAPPAPAPSSAAAPAGSGECLLLADKANNALHDAAMLLLRPPVDQNAWSSAESDVSSAISSAESACGGGAAEEAQAALSLMRTSLGELSQAAHGGGGATNTAQRQGEIDEHLNKARGR